MGLVYALQEITLVFFTTAAPGGIVACCFILLMNLCKPEIYTREKLRKLLVLPYIASLWGLIASATHLGSPHNALYVLCGVGTSPLSNEVFAAVLFLGALNLYWLFSFSQKPLTGLLTMLKLASLAAGALYLLGIAYAYEVATILSWRSSLVPLLLITSAFITGPELVIVSKFAAGMVVDKTALRRSWRITAGACALHLYLLKLHIGFLQTLANSGLGESDLIGTPFIWFAVLTGLLVVSVIAGFVIYRKSASLSFGARAGLSLGLCILLFGSICIERLLFYMSYLSVGTTFN